MIALPSSAWVPTTISTVPSARPFLVSDMSFEVTRREACRTTMGSPLKRSEKVLKCWRASSVVGTTTATCLPFSATAKAARMRHLGLAEADIAADQPVHRVAGAEIVEHRIDGGVLVLGLLIGEAGAELVIEPGRRHQDRGASLSWRSAATLMSSAAISRMRLRIFALRACQPPPPSRSSCASVSSEP